MHTLFGSGDAVDDDGIVYSKELKYLCRNLLHKVCETIYRINIFVAGMCSMIYDAAAAAGVTDVTD